MVAAGTVIQGEDAAILYWYVQISIILAKIAKFDVLF